VSAYIYTQAMRLTHGDVGEGGLDCSGANYFGARASLHFDVALVYVVYFAWIHSRADSVCIHVCVYEYVHICVHLCVCSSLGGCTALSP